MGTVCPRSYRVLRVSELMFSCEPCGHYLGPCEHFAVSHTQKSRKHMGVITPDIIMKIYYLNAFNHTKNYKLYLDYYFLFFRVFGIQSVSNKVVNFLYK